MGVLTELAEEAGQLLKDRKATICVGESSTGGLISAALLSIPGASAYYVGGGVFYTYQARDNLLALDADALEKFRPSTEDYALLAAKTLQIRLQTTWSLCETGAAGPTGNRYGDPAGHSCIALTGPVERAVTIETRQTDREQNMWAFAEAALGLVKQVLHEEHPLLPG